MSRGASWAIVFASAMVFLVGPSAATPEAFAAVEGVPYYFAYGDFASSTLALGDAADGQGTLAFRGCAYAQLRPEMEHGIVRILGTIDDVTTVDITVNSFDDSSPDPVAMDIAVDGALDPTAPAKPAAHASIAASGTARLRIDANPYKDPATGNNLTEAQFFVTDQGFRDETTLLPGAAVPEDWEIHVRLNSIPGTKAMPETIAFAPEGELPDGSFLPSETHGTRLLVDNTRFGGTGKLHVTAEANAPEGMNEILFTVRSPTGLALGNVTLRPALQAPDQGDIDFPLTEFGTYSMTSAGKVALSKYRMDVTLTPPPSFELNLWWENVTLGSEAPSGYSQCQQQVQRPGGSVVGSVVARPLPPGYDVSTVAVAVAATALAVLLVVALLLHAASSSRMRKPK